MNLGAERIFWVLRFVFGAGIFSFLNAAVCTNCEKQISNRYLLVKCTGGAAFIWCASFYGTGRTGVISMRGLLVFVFLTVLGFIAVNDYRTHAIDNRFHAVIFALGVAAVWLFPEHGIVEKCIGALIVSVPMLLTVLVFPGAFGGGDIKLMAVCGWFLGAKAVVCAAIISVFAAGSYYGVMLMCQKVSRKTQVAFGPWLAAGLSVAAFYGDFLADSYLKIM